MTPSGQETEKKELRVLWMPAEPAVLHSRVSGGWVTSLEAALTDLAGDGIRPGFVYPSEDAEPFRTDREGTVCYPVSIRPRKTELFRKIWTKTRLTLQWECLKPQLLRIIADFKPDIIHVFGSENTFGAIAAETSVPVVIHMMGFLNAYLPAVDTAISRKERYGTGRILLQKLLSGISGGLHADRVSPEAFERRIMQANRYFMGRTDWDRNVVKYYSPGARYFHIGEALRPEIFDAAGKWQYHFSGKLILSTITLGDERKGPEIILRTAKLLRDLVGIDFTWRVAGRKDWFPFFEKKTGIRCEDVHIELLGQINGTQVAEELLGADFFIHPSLIDNSPNSVCEAQLVGCPVLASFVGGVTSLIEDGVTGFFYPYNEPHALAFLIADLLEDRDRLTRVSENASAMALRRHDPAKIAETVLDTYQEIIAENRPGT